MSFDVTGSDPLTVTVPTRRPDVRTKVDLVEEIARLHGFAGIPDRVPSGPGGALSVTQRRLRLVRSVMVGAGFYQTMTFSFIGKSDLDGLALPEGHTSRSGITVTNPLNDTEGVMRTTLLPGLLKAASAALSRRIPFAKLFEVGKVFLPGEGKLPEQPDRLGFVLAGEVPSTWSEPARTFDVFDGTGTWEAIAEALAIPDARVRQASVPPFHPGRCAEIVIGDVVIGAVGEVAPQVANTFGLSGRVVVGEMDLAELVVDRGAWTYRPPSPFPPVIFDMAFNVDRSVPASHVLDAAIDGAGDHHEAAHVFDVFEGDSIGQGKKSVAIRFTLRAADRTLTDEEAAPVRRAIADVVATRVGGELRGTL
jgi:phenylalanyl-tRNA synthetase beta chain